MENNTIEILHIKQMYRDIKIGEKVSADEFQAIP